MKNRNTGEFTLLWINKDDKIMVQSRSSFSKWHGSWEEDDDLEVYKCSCNTEGIETYCVSVIILGTKPNHFSGVNGLGEDVEIRYKRKVAMCPRCGKHVSSEQGTTFLHDASEVCPGKLTIISAYTSV